MKRLVIVLCALCVLTLVGWSRTRAHAQGGMMMHPVPKAVKNVQKAVMSIKMKAEKAGRYNCCLKHSCNSCAMMMGMCPCGKMASMNKPVCNECKGGWYAGDGDVPGKTANEIKTMPRGMKMMMGKMHGNMMGKMHGKM